MIEESRLTMVTPEGELWQAAFSWLTHSAFGAYNNPCDKKSEKKTAKGHKENEQESSIF